MMFSRKQLLERISSKRVVLLQRALRRIGRGPIPRTRSSSGTSRIAHPKPPHGSRTCPQSLHTVDKRAGALLLLQATTCQC